MGRTTPSERLTVRALNRALLARQWLLGRVRRGVPAAVEHLASLAGPASGPGPRRERVLAGLAAPAVIDTAHAATPKNIVVQAKGIDDIIGAFDPAESYEYTDIDRTFAAGASLSGARWGRKDDTVAIAVVVNGISKVHEAFLAAGGLGILVGDGQLPHPGLEQILEAYYSFPVGDWRVTADYQFIVNPAYNRDRGPVSVFALQLHLQY